MRKGFGVSQRIETSVGLRIDPRVVITSKLLQCGRQELEQAIEAEMMENPALERLESEEEPLDDDTILRSVAPQELRPSSEDFEFQRSIPQEDVADWMDFAASSDTLWDHLRGQLLATLPHHLHPVACYLIESVNDRGYLTITVEEAALATNSSLEEAEIALEALRQCEPLGIGATNLQDCLLLQLRDADTIERKLARAIIRSHMESFVQRNVAKLSRRFKVLPEVVEAAFDEILDLSPYPGEAFQPAYRTQSGSRAVSVSPDVVITRSENGWEVDVKGADPGNLCINRSYRRRLRELSHMDRAPKDEKRHVTAYVRRATDFISALQQRRKTLRRVGEYIVQHQSGFVSTGSYQFLQSLTRAQMAQDLGVHESTISRATQDKFVQLANGEIVSFEVFFKPALRVQKMIEEILATENPDNPLSDERIAQMLANKGVHVARRTVNKYRDRTKLLSSRKRRTA